VPQVIDAFFHRHLGFRKNVVSAHVAWIFTSDATSSQTSVPTLRPSTASRMLPGLSMSKTTMGILLSMQRLHAVESMICKRLERASENVSRSNRCAPGYL